MTDYGKQADKLMEVFGSRWGSRNQPPERSGFKYHELTLEEANSFLNHINNIHPYDFPFKFHDYLEGCFRAHVQMEDYNDFELGYVSNLFRRDVALVLGTDPEPVVRFQEKAA